MLDIDASNFVIIVVLEQDFSRSLQPVVYESYKLRRIERNYYTHNQDQLVIVHPPKDVATLSIEKTSGCLD